MVGALKSEFVKLKLNSIYVSPIPNLSTNDSIIGGWENVSWRVQRDDPRRWRGCPHFGAVKTKKITVNYADIIRRHAPVAAMPNPGDSAGKRAAARRLFITRTRERRSDAERAKFLFACFRSDSEVLECLPLSSAAPSPTLPDRLIKKCIVHIELYRMFRILASNCRSTVGLCIFCNSELQFLAHL